MTDTAIDGAGAAYRTPAEFAARDVDLHVHTLTSACGYTLHRRLLELTRAAGRRVVAATDHDTADGAVALRELAAQTGDDLLVLVGMELTTSDFGHVVVFGPGIEEDWGWQKNRPFPRDLPEHWAAIQAHPFRDLAMAGKPFEVETLPTLPERIDAVEVWNGGDVLKKATGLRAALDRVSSNYAREYGKHAVASSDGHRPIWVHSFFTRFDRPLHSLDDAVDQIRAGQVSPKARDEAHLADCMNRWRRREVVEWREAGKDWRAMAAGAGYDAHDAECRVALFDQVRVLARAGATVAQVAGEAGLTPDEALDYLSIVEEQDGFAAAAEARRTKRQTPLVM
jgi:predicted metal-dependent phosphoesterase TrpH